MKKIITTLAVASVFIFTSCFTDTDTATVKINLGNLPMAKTAKIEKKSLIDRFLMFFAKEAVAQQVPDGIGVSVVHLGAFDINNKLLAKKRIKVTEAEEGQSDVHTVIEFDVPARSGVRIVVLGEQKSNDFFDEDDNPLDIAGYYGCSEPLNLTAGDIEEVNVYMEHLIEFLEDGEEFNFRFSTETEDNMTIFKFQWNRIYGVSRYILEYKLGNGPYSTINNNSNENCTHSFLSTNGLNFRFTLEFDFADIKSEPVDFIDII